MIITKNIYFLFFKGISSTKQTLWKKESLKFVQGLALFSLHINTALCYWILYSEVFTQGQTV